MYYNGSREDRGQKSEDGGEKGEDFFIATD
jgi:hypothetical protein